MCFEKCTPFSRSLHWHFFFPCDTKLINSLLLAEAFVVWAEQKFSPKWAANQRGVTQHLSVIYLININQISCGCDWAIKNLAYLAKFSDTNLWSKNLKDVRKVFIFSSFFHFNYNLVHITLLEVEGIRQARYFLNQPAAGSLWHDRSDATGLLWPQSCLPWKIYLCYFWDVGLLWFKIMVIGCNYASLPTLGAF